MIYILFFSLISLFIITYFVFKEDILSPAVIVCMMWTFSTLCAIYNINNWGINLHLNTVAIIILGIIIFGLSSILAFCLKVPVKLHRCNKTVEDKSILIKEISFNRIIFYIILFINIYTVLWQFNWLLSQTDLSAGWTDMMAKFRSNSSSWNVNAAEKPSLLSNLETFLSVSSYFFSYIGINNIICGEKKSRCMALFLPSVLYVIDRLLNATRGNILLLIGAMVLALYILWQKKYNWKKTISRRYIKYLIFLFIAIVIFFSASRTIVGRSEKTGIIDYITKYAGGSIQLFDMFLQDLPEKSSIWGKETFATLNNLIGRKFNVPELRYIAHLEFREANGVSIGNVYGPFRSYIYDFGYIGFAILTMLVGFMYSFVYKCIKEQKGISKNGFNFLIVVFMYFGPSLFMYSITDYTFSLLGNLIILFKWFLEILILRIFVIEIKIKIHK